MGSFHMPSAATGSVVSILNNGSNSETSPASDRPNSSEANAPKSTSGGSSGSNPTDSASGYSIGSSGTSRNSSEAATSMTSLRPESDSANSTGSQGSKQHQQYPKKMLDHPGYAQSPQPVHQQQQFPVSSTPDGPDDTTDALSVSTGVTNSPSGSSNRLRIQDPDRMSVAPSPSASSSAGSLLPKSKQPIVQGGKKRYPCSHPGCDKTFSTSGHAARHNRIHTGQKPYRCTFPGCEASFSRQDNALAHFRSGHALSKGKLGVDNDEHDIVMGGGQYDAQLEAGAELGRRALEEGTAIAVVRDGKVERTVGMPRSRKSSQAGNDIGSSLDMDDTASSFSSDRRRSSTTIPPSLSHHSGPTPAAEYAHSHRKLPTPTSRFAHDDISSREAKPSSVHSDFEIRKGPAITARRTHPYAISSARQRTTPSGGWLPGHYSSAPHTASDGGQNAAGAAALANQNADYHMSLARRFSHAWPHSSSSAAQAYATARSHRKNPSLEGNNGAARTFGPHHEGARYASTSTSGDTRSSPTWQPLRLEGLHSHARYRKPSLPTPEGQTGPFATTPLPFFAPTSTPRPALPCSSDRSTTLIDERRSSSGGGSTQEASIPTSARHVAGPGTGRYGTEAEPRIVLPPLRFPNSPA